MLQENSPEDIPKNHLLTRLAGQLGLVETSEMLVLRASVIETMKKGGDYIANCRAYEDAAIHIINGHTEDAKGQIALILLRAAMFYEAGYIELCDELMNDALTCACNAGYDDEFNIINSLCS